LTMTVTEDEIAKRRKDFKICTLDCRGEAKLMKRIVDQCRFKTTLKNNADLYVSGLHSPTGNYWAGKEDGMVSRMPGMEELGDKKITGYVLNKLAEYYPSQMDFAPRTFLIPEQYEECLSYMRSKPPSSFFVSKPSGGSEGEGIRLIRGGKDANLKFLEVTNDFEVVVQEYIGNPLLVDGKKFDLRLYVFISRLEPLEFFINDEGLARFCCENYVPPREDNIRKMYGHLTNYSLNKKSEDYKYTEETTEINDGSKQTLCSLWKKLKLQNVEKEVLWPKIKELVCKYVETIRPFLNYYSKCWFDGTHAKNKCFQVIGLDVLIDSEFKPWLLELNATPSFLIEHDNGDPMKKGVLSPVDVYVKERALGDAIRYLALKKTHRNRLTRFNSYEKLPSRSPEDSPCVLIEEILELYACLSGFKFKHELTSSQFGKLQSLNNLPEFSKLSRVDYDLLYQKTKKFQEGSMNIFGFIYAIEQLGTKIYGERFQVNKLEVLERVVLHLLYKLGKRN
jgi:tubulin polyglutamylase TTLL11